MRRGLLARTSALACAGLALAACNGSNATAPGAVSEGEARALEEAAEMLDERRLPDGALPDLDTPIAAETDAPTEAVPPSEMTGDNTE